MYTIIDKKDLNNQSLHNHHIKIMGHNLITIKLLVVKLGSLLAQLLFKRQIKHLICQLLGFLIGEYYTNICLERKDIL